MATKESSTNFLFPFGLNVPTSTPKVEIAGIKGANLASMAQIDLPVPPGFVLSTSLGREVCMGNGRLTPNQLDEIKQAITLIENELGRTFGGEAKPLLVSSALRGCSFDAGHDGHGVKPWIEQQGCGSAGARNQ